MIKNLPGLNKKGFTLIELLIVIGMVAGLATVIMFTYPNAQKRGRDANRKSDISQYRTSLEAYANRADNYYPVHNIPGGARASTTLCGELGLSNCPEDPKNPSDGTFEYRYQSDGTGNSGSPTASQYVMWVKLESSTNYWVICSTGKTGTRAQSGFSVSGGNCPI